MFAGRKGGLGGLAQAETDVQTLTIDDAAANLGTDSGDLTDFRQRRRPPPVTGGRKLSNSLASRWQTGLARAHAAAGRG
jgi:hypothetical protein